MFNEDADYTCIVMYTQTEHLNKDILIYSIDLPLYSRVGRPSACVPSCLGGNSQGTKSWCPTHHPPEMQQYILCRSFVKVTEL